MKVVQAGSFSAAARSLGMPITTVSGQVASLEKRLGITLIHRTTRKLNITRAGQAYYDHCVRALDEIYAAERGLAAEKIEPEGLLKITCPPDIGHTLLLPIVQSYLNKYPKVKVELVLTNRIVDLVGEGVDLAIRVGALKDSTLVSQKFMDSNLTICASKSYIKKYGSPKSPQDLTRHSYIGFRSIPLLKLIRNEIVEKVEINSRIIVDDMEAIKAFALNGEGIAAMPSFLCEAEIASGQLIKLLPDWNFDIGPKIQIWLVYPPQRFVSARLRAFIEIAKSKGL